MSAAGVNLSGKDRDISIFMPVVMVLIVLLKILNANNKRFRKEGRKKV